MTQGNTKYSLIGTDFRRKFATKRKKVLKEIYSPVLTYLFIERKFSLPGLTHTGVFSVWVVPKSFFDVSSDNLPGTHQILVGLPDPVAPGLPHTS